MNAADGDEAPGGLAGARTAGGLDRDGTAGVPHRGAATGVPGAEPAAGGPDRERVAGVADTTDRQVPPPVTLPDEVLVGLVHSLADAVVVADRRGTIRFWNDAATRLFGWPAEDAVGRTLDLIVPERFRARHWEGYDQVMATGQTRYGDRLLEVPARHREGRALSIAFTVTLVSAPGDPSDRLIAAVARDDTERWRRHRALTAELEAARSLAPPDPRRI